MTVRLTDDKLRKLNVTWQRMEPNTTIASAFAELVERRDADFTDEEIEALRGLRDSLGPPIMNWRPERVALAALDRLIASRSKI